jgi:acetyltransferase-like isoleucine patch superfamily enzyme
MIKYLGKTGWDAIFCLLNDIRAKVYTKLISRSFYSFGKKSTIIPPFRFANPDLISIGNYVTINSYSWVQVVGKFFKEDVGPRLVIEDGVSIGMNATISACQEIKIGKNVFLARNVYISDHGHEFKDPDLPIAVQGISKPGPVNIGASTWLGQNSVVLPGVSIGKHCVIGANSVVNKSVPDYSVVVGVPGKIVRRYNPETDKWERVIPLDKND